MKRGIKKEKRINNASVLVFFFYIIYFFILLFSMSKVLSVWYPVEYPNNLSYERFIVAFIMLCLLFVSIKRTDKASYFFLLLTLFIQIVPLAVTFIFNGGRYVYFTIVCVGFLICIFLVQFKAPLKVNVRIVFYKKFLVGIVAISVILLLVIIYLQNGTPALTALNIYDVYDLRSSGSFVLNKYLKYFLDMVVNILLPFLIAYFICQKNYKWVMMFSAVLFLLYLYTGNKVYLFALPVVLICSLLGKSYRFSQQAIIALALFLVLSCLGAVYFENVEVFRRIYALIIKRVLLAPARIKFCYDDYFNIHERIGFYGFIPTFIYEIDSPYKGLVIGEIISKEYFSTISNSSTGMLGEAIAHFGLIGIVITWVLFAFLLKLSDKLQEKEGYQLVVGAFSFFVYSLNDAPLLGAVLVGPVVPFVLLCVAFIHRGNTVYNKELL